MFTQQFIPPAWSRFQVLVALAAIQQWLWCPADKDGRPYAAGFFQQRGALHTVLRSHRKSLHRLLARRACLRCEEQITTNGTEDHLHPRHLGGPNTPDNYWPLCPSCNASKGTLDAIVWWVKSGKRFHDLGYDPILIYINLYFRLWSW